MARTRARTGVPIQPFAWPGPGTTVGEQHTMPDGRVFEWDGANWVLVSGGGGGGFADPTTTLGDLIVRGATAPPTRLGVGANDQVLTADSTATLGITWKAGGGAASFTHTQTTASDNWVLAHNLATLYPAIQIVGSTGNTILSDVEFVSTIRTDIHFSEAITGTAIARK